MRYNEFFGVLALAATASLGVAPSVMAEDAAAVADPKFSTSKSTVGALMADPDAKAIVMKIIPEFAQGGSDGMERLAGMTLMELKAAVGAYAPDLVTDARLAQIEAELAKLGAAKAPVAAKQ